VWVGAVPVVPPPPPSAAREHAGRGAKDNLPLFLRPPFFLRPWRRGFHIRALEPHSLSKPCGDPMVWRVCKTSVRCTAASRRCTSTLPAKGCRTRRLARGVSSGATPFEQWPAIGGSWPPWVRHKCCRPCAVRSLSLARSLCRARSGLRHKVFVNALGAWRLQRDEHPRGRKSRDQHKQGRSSSTACEDCSNEQGHGAPSGVSRRLCRPYRGFSSSRCFGMPIA